MTFLIQANQMYDLIVGYQKAPYRIFSVVCNILNHLISPQIIYLICQQTQLHNIFRCTKIAEIADPCYRLAELQPGMD